MRVSSFTLPLFSLLLAVAAHPGEVEEHGTPARREFLSYARRSIEGCQGALVARGIEARAIKRRAALAEKIRAKRGLPMRKRSFDDVLNTSHKSNVTGLTPQVDGGDLFTGNLASVLQSESVVGPYWVSGELIRGNVIECQKGVPLYADIQLVDVSTCEPLSNVYVDSWHSNSTGVYAGVVARGNGDLSDTSNINSTFLRGIQRTDDDGVVYFETLVPGHYAGRTPHIHIMATINATVFQNNTLTGGSIAHVGQLFFDQDLITAVEATEPYINNQQPLLLNKNDGIFAEEAGTTDPVLKYVLLGDTLAEGIFAWISVGIDPTAEYNATAAVAWGRDGGIANPNAGGPGGPDGPGGPGGPGGPPPSGSFPGFPGSPTSTIIASSSSASTISVTSSVNPPTNPTLTTISSFEPSATAVH